MAERDTEKMTEWLDIHVESLSSEERIRLIEEIFETLTAQELRAIRDLAEKNRQRKLESAKASVLKEMKEKISELGLTLNDVFPTRSKRPRKNIAKAAVPVKYRSPDGVNTWSGRGHAPLWLRQLELQGHTRDAFKVSEG